MKLQRQVGQTSQILLLFVQDVSVTTGAGLANIIGSSVSYTWFHNNQISVSTGTASTAGTTGTYSTSAWVMISSSNALGWYQFGAPDGIFSTGDSVGIHFYGAPNMVPLPVEIELVRDNPLQFSSSKVFLAHTSTSPANITQALAQPIVTSGAGILNVSTQAIDKGGYGVTTVAANITTNANVMQIYGSAAVTSASGQFRVSTQAIDKGGYGVTTVAANITTNANIMEVYGTAIVTSGAGILNVSTQTLVAGAGDVISVYGVPIVTTGAGIILTSTQTIPTFASAGDAMALTSGERASLAGVILSTTQAEGFRASSAAGSITQLAYEILANLTEAANTGTSRAVGSLTSHAAQLEYQYDNSSAPNSVTRIV